MTKKSEPTSSVHETLPVTEQENPRTKDIDTLDAHDIVRLMNAEDRNVAVAVESALPDVARAVEEITKRLRVGGRVFYVGTGTSGRLGVLDAAECPPTFGVEPELVQGIIAGGYEACHKAVEASEDDADTGGRDLEARALTPLDAVVGLAASGRTPYTIGALEYANSLDAFTVCVTCVPDSAITRVASVPIVAVVGAEVITGSTRLKSGTAQKMILNMISTAVMIRLGYVKGNRMTHVQTRNVKLKERATRILMAERDVDLTIASRMLESANGDLQKALNDAENVNLNL